MAKPVVLMLSAYTEWDMAPMEEAYDVRKLWLAADKEAFLAATTPEARAIATHGELGASAALIDRCPRLEIIACYGVGVDAIDVKRAKERGVRVTNTPEVLTDGVADFAFALILGHLRKNRRGRRACAFGGVEERRAAAWPRAERQEARHSRLWPHRPRHRAAGAGL